MKLPRLLGLITLEDQEDQRQTQLTTIDGCRRDVIPMHIAPELRKRKQLAVVGVLLSRFFNILVHLAGNLRVRRSSEINAPPELRLASKEQQPGSDHRLERGRTAPGVRKRDRARHEGHARCDPGVVAYVNHPHEPLHSRAPRAEHLHNEGKSPRHVHLNAGYGCK